MTINIDEDILMRAASILTQGKSTKRNQDELKELWPYFSDDPKRLALLWQTTYDAQILTHELSQKATKPDALFSTIVDPLTKGFKILTETNGLSFLDFISHPAYRSTTEAKLFKHCNAIRIIENPFQAIMEITCQIKNNKLNLQFQNKFSSETIKRMELEIKNVGLESAELKNNEASFDLSMDKDTVFTCFACTEHNKAEITGFKLSIKPAEL